MSDPAEKQNEQAKPRSKKRTFKVSEFNVHVRNCVHEQVAFRNGQYFYEKWLFRKTDFSCGSCGNTRETVFMRTTPLNIVIQSCIYCGTTTPADPRKPDGTDQAYPLEVKVVSIEDAKEVLLRNKCNPKYLPPELRRVLQAPTRPKVSPDELESLGLEEE